MGYPVIWQIEDIYYPTIAAIGVPVNVVTIAILSRGKCGVSKCITCYLMVMAMADLLVVIMDPILTCIAVMFFPYSFLRITPVCALIFFLRFAVTVVSVRLTVAFTFDRFVAICCEKLKTKYCTKTMAVVVLGTVSVLGCLESLPWYFTIQPYFIINNVPWSCMNTPNFFTSPAWGAYQLFHFIVTPCLPFFLILLLNSLTVRRILITNRVRSRLRGHSNKENQKDPELDKRRKSIILLFSISGSFILLWAVDMGYNMYARIVRTQSYSSYTDPRFIMDRAGRMLQLLSCCSNTCIYAVTQAKFREELKNAVKYPFNLIVKLLNQSTKRRVSNPGM